MNIIRVKFEDGVIYDWPVPNTMMNTCAKANLMIDAIKIAEEWRKLVVEECSIKDSFITRVEWYAYNFNQV